jgi:hypothetical protein
VPPCLPPRDDARSTLQQPFDGGGDRGPHPGVRQRFLFSRGAWSSRKKTIAVSPAPAGTRAEGPL